MKYDVPANSLTKDIEEKIEKIYRKIPKEIVSKIKEQCCIAVMGKNIDVQRGLYIPANRNYSMIILYEGAFEGTILHEFAHFALNHRNAGERKEKEADALIKKWQEK